MHITWELTLIWKHSFVKYGFSIALVYEKIQGTTAFSITYLHIQKYKKFRTIELTNNTIVLI